MVPRNFTNFEILRIDMLVPQGLWKQKDKIHAGSGKIQYFVDH